VREGREWSSLTRRTSPLARTSLFTGGMAKRSFVFIPSSKKRIERMKEKIKILRLFGMI
jgi:hypothetical protein